MLANKRILLIIGGGIAAYKSLELIRRLQDAGAQVRAVLTAGGAQFITPLSVASLTGDKCYSDLFSLTDEAEMGHIRLSRECDLILVAPATADLMARMTAGMANDLATTTLLATDKPVMIVPAMNVRMWTHQATRRNLETLRADGIHVIDPDEGPMACGEYGPGRLAEVTNIVTRVKQFFGTAEAARPLQGHRVLVTAGPTHEPIDPVRYIANRSSGKQGFALAAALARLGADVDLVTGPVNLPTPASVRRHDIETADQMLTACEAVLPVDAAICVAAVADWRPQAAATQKVKKAKGASAPALSLVENPDILARLSSHEQRPALVVGFAAETENLVAHARAKLARKGCDWIVANDVSAANGVMGGEDNTVIIVREGGEETLPKASKVEVAARLAEAIAADLADRLGKGRP